ncbi:MAG TPA: FkbM family methyltransferase [Bryobacterales bacterium]|nr:FkbM family methyltransferase [Bryobacterales bacterium]
MFSILEVLNGARPLISIVDAGAMTLGAATEVYHPLMSAGLAQVLGFEAVQAECEKLNATAGEGRRYLPFAVGDGTRRTLHVCNYPMTSSLYEPNFPLLDFYQNLGNLCQVVRRQEIDTVRLDDIPEASEADFLKLDVQGAELDVLRGARKVLASAVAVQTEVEFVPLYKNQPLFAEVDQELRSRGFWFHRFFGLAGRAIKPVIINNDINATIGQVLWGDAVYIRDLMQLETLPAGKLLRLAVILHEVYCSVDTCLHVLAHYDRKAGSSLAPSYLARLTGGRAGAGA